MKSLSLVVLLKKDFLMFFRSKFSSAVILLIPLIIILAAGYAFNTSSLSNVYVGVYSNSSTNLTEKVITDFKNNGFLVKEFSSSEECINSVKLNYVQICGVFSENISSNSSGEVVNFYVDYSKINLANTVINQVEKSVHLESSKEGKFAVQDLIDIISLTKSKLPEAKVNLDSAMTQVENNKKSLISINLSTTDIDSAITSLNNSLPLINDSGNGSIAKSKINLAIGVLNSLKSSNEKFLVDISGIISSEGDVYSDLQMTQGKIDSVLTNVNSKTISDADKIVSPIKSEIKPMNKNTKSRDYLFPILISLIALFGAVLISSTFVLKEKKTIAYFRNFMTPTKSFMFIFSKYLTCLIILSFQFVLVFLGIKFVLGMNNFPINLELATVMILSLSVFIFIGMFIGYLFRSEESVIFGSVIIAGVFLFFSSLIFPIQSAASTLINFSFFNPLIVMDSALRKIILFGFGFSSFEIELYYFGGFLVVFAFLTYLARKVTRRML